MSYVDISTQGHQEKIGRGPSHEKWFISFDMDARGVICNFKNHILSKSYIDTLKITCAIDISCN